MLGLPATYVTRRWSADRDLLTSASQIFSGAERPDTAATRLASAPARPRRVRSGDDGHRSPRRHRCPRLDVGHELERHGVLRDQVFFPRTSAWESLRKALKSTHDESVWEHLAGDTSAPFAAPIGTEIAVKVLDDRGNELPVIRRLTPPASAVRGRDALKVAAE